MWNPFSWLSRSKSPAKRRQKKARKPVKAQGIWEPVTVIEHDPRTGETSFTRSGGKQRVIPLRSDTFKRLNLGPMNIGQEFEIRMGTTHLGPEVAAIRPHRK